MMSSPSTRRLGSHQRSSSPLHRQDASTAPRRHVRRAEEVYQPVSRAQLGQQPAQRSTTPTMTSSPGRCGWRPASTTSDAICAATGTAFQPCALRTTRGQGDSTPPTPSTCEVEVASDLGETGDRGEDPDGDGVSARLLTRRRSATTFSTSSLTLYSAGRGPGACGSCGGPVGYDSRATPIRP
jgi:hypothetical protein